MKFHVNEKGNVGQCRATKACPFGGEHAHFESQDDARLAFENLMRAQARYNTPVYFHQLAIDEKLQEVLATLQKVGNPLIVGGAVRDSLTGAESKDIDIEVHGAELDKIAKVLSQSGYAVDEVGKQFGVLKVSKKNHITDLDISVPRRENLVGAHHRSFEVEIDSTMTVEEAGSRRDFTFNALYYDPFLRVIVDPYRGKQDFETKTMRHVSAKFAEDPLRVLRGFQFASRFSLTVAPETAELAQALRSQYSSLSKERVQEEWEKFFTKSIDFAKGVQALQQMQWDDTEPGLRQALASPGMGEKLQQLTTVAHEKRVIFGSALIAQAMASKDRENFIRTIVEGKSRQTLALDLLATDPAELTTSEARKAHAFKLAGRGFTYNDYHAFATLAHDSAAKLVAEQAIEEKLGSGPEEDLLAGRDVVTLTDRRPGPWMGELLREARQRQYRNEFKDKNAATEWLKLRLEEK